MWETFKRGRLRLVRVKLYLTTSVPLEDGNNSCLTGHDYSCILLAVSKPIR